MIEHNKSKGLVYEIIRKCATEQKPIDQAEIYSKIKEIGERCDRKTVGRTLDHLRSEYGQNEDGTWRNEEIRLHYVVVSRSSSPIYKQYWFETNCDDDEFTDDELMFLMDAVQFSKHVDQRFAEEIARKLSYLSSDRFNRVLALHTKINEKSVPVNKEFLAVQGDINKAIYERRQISFNVNEYGTDKELHQVGDRVTVCPFKIVVSDGDYYLLCAKPGSDAMKTYRVDRLTNVEITDKGFPFSSLAREAEQYPSNYIIEHRYMNSGEVVNVTLRIDRSILGEVIDSFGKKITIEEPDAAASRLTVYLKSGERDIVDWVMRYGEYAVIEDPEYLREELVERARVIAEYNNTNSNEDIRYVEEIRKTSRFNMLSLRDIDLNGRETHKNLEGVKRACFRHNGISDFSFLHSYTGLNELTISHNAISNPEVISELDSLFNLALVRTGVKDLDFLAGMERISKLTLDEYSLENIETIYALPNLKFLTVNRAVSRMINKRRLRDAFGDSLRYNVSDGHRMLTPFLMNALPPVDGHHNFANRYSEELQAFSTIELTDCNKRDSLCSEIFAGLRARGGNGERFEIIDETCDSNERVRLFENMEIFAGKQYAWYVTYKGELLEEDELDTDKVYTISIFKQDHGLKLVGIARHLPPEGLSTPESKTIYDELIYAFYAHIRYLLDNEIGWMELGGEAARAFSRVSTMSDLIDPNTLIGSGVSDSIEIDADDYHYFRKDGRGRKRKKIAYGFIL